jgi:hypothetical protein
MCQNIPKTYLIFQKDIPSMNTQSLQGKDIIYAYLWIVYNSPYNWRNVKLTQFFIKTSVEYYIF